MVYEARCQADTARAIFDKWDLDFMPIGKVTETQPFGAVERW